MGQKLLGRKRGMIQRFDAAGNIIVCTIIEAEPNTVTKIKTKEKEGYRAVQFGFEKMIAKDERTIARRMGQPLMGHFLKCGVAPHRFLEEYRLDEQDEAPQVGDTLTVGFLEEGCYVDVSGTSKGKGFQGLIKLKNFSGGPGSHGSGFHRHAGSTGMRSTPGRCLPGSPRPSQMGNRQCTTANLRVVSVDVEKNLVLVAGAIPGPTGGVVRLNKAKKKHTQQKQKKKND